MVIEGLPRAPVRALWSRKARAHQGVLQHSPLILGDSEIAFEEKMPQNLQV